MDISRSRGHVIAGDIALAVFQGLLRSGSRIPRPANFAGPYNVPPSTALAALQKLEREGLALHSEDGYQIADGTGDPGYALVLHLYAVGRLVRRVDIWACEEAKNGMLEDELVSLGATVTRRSRRIQFGDRMLPVLSAILEHGLKMAGGPIAEGDTLMKALGGGT